MAKFELGEIVIAKKKDNSFCNRFMKGDTLQIVGYGEDVDYCIKNLTRPRMTDVYGYAFKHELKPVRTRSLKDEKCYESKYYLFGIPIVKKRSKRCDCE